MDLAVEMVVAVHQTAMDPRMPVEMVDLEDQVVYLIAMHHHHLA